MFSYHSATVRIDALPESRGGVLEVVWGGLLTEEATHALWSAHHQTTRLAPALVIRIDTGACAFGDPGVISKAQMAETPPSALVVPPSLYDKYRVFIRDLAERGILRAIFLPSQLLYARQWAEDHCRVGDPQSPASQQRRPESDFAPL
jgi:hypothetical protein